MLNKTCEEFLKEYFSTHPVEKSGNNDLIAHYKLFSAFDIKDLRDLSGSPNRYATFLNDNIHLIKTGKSIAIGELPKIIEQARITLNRRLSSAMTKPVSDFSHIVADVSPNKKESHVLDVGSGNVPYSSILLGKQFESVSTMDSEFLLSNAALDRMNVNAIDKFFTSSTNVKQYDIVVGKAPCSAIENIVRQCASEGKPYFIELCDCALPTKNYVAGWSGWQDILPEIDEYVKFYTAGTTFAFNLDASEEQVKKVIDKHIPKRIFVDVLTPKTFAQTQSPLKTTETKPKSLLKNNDVFESSNVAQQPKLSSKQKHQTNSNKNTQKTEPKHQAEIKEDNVDFLTLEMFERG